ncbi:MAG: SDR family oxidoreductase [Firmicutes bacterium]|nr:SDR family oxidoreductase [Bacillota bacterium]
MEMKGQVALVTGAGQGIGRAIARALAGAGARLALVDRNPGTLSAIAGELTADGAEVWSKVADVSSAAEVRSAVAAAHRHYGRLDILVNNAGVMGTGTVETCSEAEWDRILGVNLKGTFLCCQAAVPLMKARRYGRIVNLASSAGKSAVTVSGISYVASKAAVIGITRQLAHQLAPYGITSNAVAPGPIDTEMPRSSFSGEVLQRLEGGIPVGRFGRPEDVARAVLFLASPESDFITGETLDVNGGSLID